MFAREGRHSFNYLGLERFTFTGNGPLPRGKVRLAVYFVYNGKPGELGKVLP
jgi:hypothetical protein